MVLDIGAIGASWLSTIQLAELNWRDRVGPTCQWIGLILARQSEERANKIAMLRKRRWFEVKGMTGWVRRTSMSFHRKWINVQSLGLISATGMVPASMQFLCL